MAAKPAQQLPIAATLSTELPVTRQPSLLVDHDGVVVRPWYPRRQDAHALDFARLAGAVGGQPRVPDDAQFPGGRHERRDAKESHLNSSRSGDGSSSSESLGECDRLRWAAPSARSQRSWGDAAPHPPTWERALLRAIRCQAPMS